MDEAGLPARAAADQLRHAKPSLTGGDIYVGRRKGATGAAEVLEDLFQPDRRGSSSDASWTARDRAGLASAGRPAAPARPQWILGGIARGGPPDGLLPTSEQDDLVRIFHESLGLSELEARFCDGRSAPSPMAAGAAQVPVVESEGQFGRG